MSEFGRVCKRRVLPANVSKSSGHVYVRQMGVILNNEKHVEVDSFKYLG